MSTRSSRVRTSVHLALLALVGAMLVVLAPSPASATRFNWPGGWTNPAGSSQWEDWDFNQCGYVVVNGQQWAHLGNDSQGYRSGPVRSIGNGVVKRVITDPAPNNGLMVEYQSTAGPFTLLYQHVNPGASVGATVAAGQQIGTVANWPDTSNNHVHVSLIPGAYSAGTSWYGYRNCATGAGSGGGHVNPIPWLAANGPGGGGTPSNDGDGDGIPDGQDKCPSHRGVAVSQGCPESNLVRGGGFENASGWGATASTNFVTYANGQRAPGENARSGNRFAAFNTSTSGGGIFQDVAVNIAPGDTYCASAFVRSQTGESASGTFTLWMLGGTNEQASRDYNASSKPNGWTPLSTCATAMSSHTQLRIQFYPTPHGGTTNLDDVNLARSLVQGGGFENASGWSPAAGTNFVTYANGQRASGENARSGNRFAAFNTSTSGGGIFQDVAVNISPGDTYCASAFARSQTGDSASGTFTLWMLGGANEQASRDYKALGTQDNWTPISTCATATQSHTQLRIQFYPTPHGGTTNLDDVNLARSLVQGGGFENASGWSPAAGTNFVTYTNGQRAPGENARSGNRFAAFNTTTNGGGIFQDIAATISPGDTYCASAFARSEGGNASGQLALWMLGGTNEVATRDYSGLGVRDDWTPLSTCVTATQNHSALRIQFYPTPNGGTTQLDDVSFGNFAELPKQALTNTRRPTVSGTAAVGERLVADPGSWLPDASTLEYAWLRGEQVVAVGSDSSYVLTEADRGAVMSVQVRGGRFGYDTSQARSLPTAVVAPRAPTTGSSTLVPSRMKAPKVVVRRGKVTITWRTPPSASAITAYLVDFRKGKDRSVRGKSSKLVIKKLKPGRYKIRMAARNAAGVSPYTAWVRFKVR